MARSPITTLLPAFMLTCTALLVGCGAGKSGAPPERRATIDSLVIAEALGSADAQRELERREEVREVRAEAEFPRFGLRNETGRLSAIERLRDRAFDTRLQKTPFDKAVDKLPLRAPPLHVLQWVLTDRSPTLQTRAQRERFYRLSKRVQSQWLVPKLEHKLYARVDEQQFYAMSESARAAAVKAFYHDAERLFRQAGIRDFVLVVTPLTETLARLPELAVGRGGSASLTLLGRARSGRGV